MASRRGKRSTPPNESRIALIRSVAYARKQKPGGSSDDEDDEGEPPERPTIHGIVEAALPDQATKPVDAPVPVVEVNAPPDEPPTRARAATLSMPIVPIAHGPPEAVEMLPSKADIRIDLLGAEDPTHMPKPREIPDGSPDDPAAPPGMVPPGDSRSLRRRAGATYDFALIYRHQTFVITRFGMVGTRGVWRVVEYPTSASASHAYAKEASRFVSEGFSDYRP